MKKPSHLERDFVRRLDLSKRRSKTQLKESFEHIIASYDNENDKSKLMDYLRAIKQELVSYREASPFLVRVMETSAQLSIIYGDSNQMNDSFGFLLEYYRSNNKYNPKLLFIFLLILILENKIMELQRILCRLPNSVFFERKASFSVQEILRIQKDLAVGNYQSVFTCLNRENDRCFFSLRKIYIPKLRSQQIETISKIFKFKLSLKKACSYLGFTENEIEDLCIAKNLTNEQGKIF